MAHFLWTQKQDIGPPGRHGVAMAFDATRRRVVLFGGRTNSAEMMNDTWEWDGNVWVQAADAGPPARCLHALAYDSRRERTVLYGGSGGMGSSTDLLGDTWEWDGNEWTQMADTGPAVRSNHAVAFDTKRRRIVLFGGSSGIIPLGDTWVWDGTEWTQEQDSGPNIRDNHRMVYDIARDRIVLFGGLANYPVRDFVNDTWEYDGTRWVHVADTGPPPRSGHGMIYDGAKVLLFGGADSGSSFGDTWEWDGTHWRELQNMGPAPRAFFGMAHDGVRKHTTLYGGQNNNNQYLGDTWEWYDHPTPST